MELRCNWELLFNLKLGKLRSQEFFVGFLHKLFFGVLKHDLVLFVAVFANVEIIRLGLDVFRWVLSFEIFDCLGTPAFGWRLPYNSSNCSILEIFSALNNTELWMMLVFLGGWDGQNLSWIENLVNVIACKCAGCLLELPCYLCFSLVWN